jgi:putative transposase
MPNYRRVRVPGGCYFLTLVTSKRSPLFASADSRRILGAALAWVRRQHPFTLNAIVLMPDHLHVLLTLPPGDSDYATRVMLLKKRFTETSRKLGICSQGAVGRGEKGLSKPQYWQRRYWEHTIRSQDDFAAHLDYMMFNPVKHGLVQTPAEWPHSSIHRLVQLGVYSRDWGGNSASVGSVTREAGE